MLLSDKKMPKILMLGWEFPPVINGGLGIACHDLAIAMGTHAEITMIIPKATEGLAFENLNLIGLNNISADFSSFSEKRKKKFPKEKTVYVPSNLNPYYFDGINYLKEEEELHEKKTENEIGDFCIDSLYGGDVIAKVKHYAKIATQIALQRDFDIIHCHDWMTMLAGLAIKKETGKPLVVHLHSLEVDRGGPDSRGWVYQTEKKCMEEADILMPVSNFTAEIIKKHYGISKEKIFTVHNGIRKVKPFKTKKNYKEKTVLFIGRLTRQKGPEFFLDIACRILKANPDVRFVMAGSGNNYTKMIEDSAFKNIGNKFHFTGFLNKKELKNLLSITDVYVMPSVSEPFGLSAVEAAQFGIPCVISKQSGVAEVLQGSLKFDFWDTKKASDYILNLLKDKVLAEKIKTDAYKNLKHISWEIAAKKVIDTYRHCNFISN